MTLAMRKSTPWQDRFWAKVRMAPGDSCWEWKASRSKNGYGAFGRSRERGMESAHRLAYESAYHEIPPKMVVCHRCDNKGCCRPNHLFLGTQADNVRDMISKGRESKGEARWNTKLRDSDVSDIRSKISEGVSKSEIAKSYSVSLATISEIASKKRWRHV